MSDALPLLLPHAGPMRLLARVLSHDGAETVCAARPGESALFAGADGELPSWVGIELMAQCAAAHGGLLGRAHGEAPRPGLFVGSRRVVFRCARFAPEAELHVRARLALRRGDTLAFDCAIDDPAGGAPLVEGRLNVLLLPGIPVRGRA
jgi:predicted hotdog family 3-hydroxylacyl-ACP dehydratase